MTPQSNFMILAPIAPGREAELRQLLTSMNDAPGRVNANNTLIPFGKCGTLHFARLVILNDKTLNDIRAYGLPVRSYPLYLAFLGDVDGDPDAFLKELARLAPKGLSALFSCCEEFRSEADLVRWMKEHSARPIASYVNWRGRTVRRIREEDALRNALEEYIQSNATALSNFSPRELHTTLRNFVDVEKSAGRLRLTRERPTPIRWWIRNLLHFIGLPLLFLFVSPLLIGLAVIFIIRLRSLEKTDPELCPRVDQAYSNELAMAEDHDVTNQFTAMGSLKPGIVRLCTVIFVLLVVDYGARHIFTRGRLARVRTIHFARWVFLDGRKRMVFFSNYDGTVESYMDDFINKAGFGLNAVFSNGIGYPKTNWLIRDGCADEQKYKHYLRRHTLPTQVWYKACPGLTTTDFERNGLIRQGLESSWLSDQEIREWVTLL